MTAVLLTFPTRLRGGLVEGRNLVSGGSHGTENHLHAPSVIGFVQSAPQLNDDRLEALADALLRAWKRRDAVHKLVRLSAGASRAIHLSVRRRAPDSKR